jgi:hypothetical protein
MEDKPPKTNLRKELFDQPEDITFPGRQSLLEIIEQQLNVEGDVWIHHAYKVPSEDPLLIEEYTDVEYQDHVIIPSILHTLVDKIGSQRTTSISAISGMKQPDLLFLLDPVSSNIAIIYKERLWITEILLRRADFLYPSPYERTNALTNILVDVPQVEVFQEDISIEINGHKKNGGIEQDNILVPLDSNYRPLLGKKDPASKLKSPLQRLSDAGELILMISDAITSSAKMYLGTVNIRLNKDLSAFEYPQNVNIACLKVYKRYIDVVEISSPAKPISVELQYINFRIFRTDITRSLKMMIKILHL